MGIPRLTQDVLPFIESAILGNSLQATDSIQLQKVVIDGPSLVYHVCNKLLLLHGSKAIKVPPTYTQINVWLLQFLEDLKSCGVEIIRIFFDGALPASKRDIRKERLERTRQQLESARRLLLHPPVQRFKAEESIASHVWSVSSATLRSPFPHPPFMVAGAIEVLRESSWKDLIVVVPGEADPFCASLTASSGAAVLSNDSDLLLFDLRKGSIIPFHDLQLEKPVGARPFIRTQCLRPCQIAKKLGVPSMLRYGYQRYLDSSATSSVIAERSRNGKQEVEHQDSWQQFSKEYQTVQAEAVPASKYNMDPRTAELIFSFEAGEEMHVYLPTLIEDHDRDSSWSYGLQLRQLAYSILSRSRGHEVSDNVTEHARRGACIGDTKLNCLTETIGVKELDQFLSLHNRYITANKSQSTKAEIILDYYLLASHIVTEKRIHNNKAYSITLHKLFNSHPSILNDYDWSDIHFLANIQAVLYSIRMIHQITIHTLQTCSSTPSLTEKLRMASTNLQTLPLIPELFVDITELHHYLRKLPPENIDTKVNQMLSNLDGENNNNNNNNNNYISPSNPPAEQNRPKNLPKIPSSTPTTNNDIWIQAQPNSQIKRSNKRHKKNNKPPPSSQAHQSPLITKSNSSSNFRNPFSILQTD